MLWRKALRDLWISGGRTFLLVTVMASSTAVFGLLLAAHVVTGITEREQYLGAQPAHAILTIPEFGDELLQTVSREPGVVRAEGRRVVPSRLEARPGHWIPLEITSVSDFDEWEIGRVYLEDGIAWPPPQGAILLEGSLRDAGPIGDHVSVRTIGGILRRLEVAGFVNDPTVVQYALTRTAYGLVTWRTMEDFREPTAYNRLLIMTEADDRVSVERVVTRVVEKVEDEGYPVLRSAIPTPGKSLRADPQAAVLFILSEIGLLTIGLAAFLVGNVVTAVMAGQVNQIGILRALGAGTGRIAGLYVRQLLIYGAAAALFALPVAFILGRELSQQIADRTNFLMPRFWLPPGVAALQITTGFALPLLAASLPVLRASRMPTLEALAERSLPRVDGRPLNHSLIRGVGLPILARMAIRNVFRRLARTLLTIGMLSLAGATFIAVLESRVSLQADLLNLQRTVNYDVSLTTAAPLPQSTFLGRALRIPGVERAEAWLQSEARVVLPDRVTGGIPLLGIPRESTMTRPIILQGRWFVGSDVFAVFLSSNILDLLPGLQPGDTVVLRIAGEERRWSVIGLEARQLRPTAVVPRDALQRVTGLTGMADTVVVQTASGSADAQEGIEGKLRASFQRWDIAGTRTTSEERQSQAAQLDLLLWLLWVVVLLVLVDGALGLAVTMGLNVLERTREIGVLRALGAPARSVRILMIGEGILMGMTSWTLGVAAALPLGAWLTSTIGEILYDRPVEAFFSVPAALSWLLIVLVIVATSCLVPAQRAVSVPVRDALAYLG